jgi:hypothetical protein
MLKQVPPEEHLRCDSFRELCQGLPNVHAMTTDGAYDFLRRCSAGEVGPCVLVTGMCDYSIRLQAEHHPNKDLVAHAMSVDFAAAAAETDVYRYFQIGPAANDKCHPKDRYAVRTDRFTWWTFDELPPNVLEWYTTNLDVEHPRMKWLPFGLNNDGPGSDMLPRFVGREKKGLVYVNFSPNTVERCRLKQFFEKQSWATYRDEANLPVEQYLAEVAEHKYVLAPFGCGLDTYRTWEAIYLGAIPILPESVFARQLRALHLPVVTLPPQGFFTMTPALLTDSYPEICDDSYEYAPLTKSYWRKKFENSSLDAARKPRRS